MLYGSVAREQATEESDVDIAIVLNKEFSSENRDKFIDWVAELDLKYDRVFSIVDIEHEKFEKWKNILPFYKNIQDEGVVLWKAA
ncbi:MAG: nucleotidyltransferase domain-containing protein [Frisingicoccus sp.]|nr:nucleotidyltransferase domain-containing protein [Frisingicoccus sp.]